MKEQARETAWRFLRYSAEGVPEGPVAIQYVVGLEDACQAAARAHLAAEARAERAEAQVKAVRGVCEQQVKDRSLYSADRDKYGIDRIDGWNDALDIVEQALDGAK